MRTGTWLCQAAAAAAATELGGECAAMEVDVDVGSGGGGGGRVCAPGVTFAALVAGPGGRALQPWPSEPSAQL